MINQRAKRAMFHRCYYWRVSPIFDVSIPTTAIQNLGEQSDTLTTHHFMR